MPTKKSLRYFAQKFFSRKKIEEDLQSKHFEDKLAEEKKKSFIKRLCEKARLCKRSPQDIGESRGGFSCERHSFDGERKVPLAKKPYEGCGTFVDKVSQKKSKVTFSNNFVYNFKVIEI